MGAGSAVPDTFCRRGIDQELSLKMEDWKSWELLTVCQVTVLSLVALPAPQVNSPGV